MSERSVFWTWRFIKHCTYTISLSAVLRDRLLYRMFVIGSDILVIEIILVIVIVSFCLIILVII